MDRMQRSSFAFERGVAVSEGREEKERVEARRVDHTGLVNMARVLCLSFPIHHTSLASLRPLTT